MKIYDEQTLIDRCKSVNAVYLYGAGFVGKVLLERFRNLANTFNGNVPIEGFIISKRENNTTQICGLYVYTIDEIVDQLKYTNDYLIIVAVMEARQQVICETLNENGIEKYNLITDICIRNILEHRESEIIFLKNRIEELENSFIRMIPKPLINVSYHLTDSCNLNCAGCYHFSPLATKGDVASIEEFESDIRKLSEVMEGEVTVLTLFGGEPLLHPKAYSFPYIIKKYLPYTQVDFITNGILIPEQPEEFWTSCIKNDVVIEWTLYPITQQLKGRIKKCLESHGVEYRYFGGESTKYLGHTVIDIDAIGTNGQKGRNDARWQWLHCERAGNCIQLKKHRLYPCSIAANAHLLKEYFQLDIRLSQYDGIDIFKAKSRQEITSFLAKPIPFCRYCNVQKQTNGHQFSISKKELAEWT